MPPPVSSTDRDMETSFNKTQYAKEQKDQLDIHTFHVISSFFQIILLLGVIGLIYWTIKWLCHTTFYLCVRLHPKNIPLKNGTKCTRINRQINYLPWAWVDPNRLIKDIYEMEKRREWHQLDRQGISVLPDLPELRIPSDPVSKMFNQWHKILNNKEAAHYCGSTNPYAREKCRNFNPNNVTERPTLKTICKNFIHTRLALTYEDDLRKFVTYHYQPQIIRKLDIPPSLKEEIIILYYECPYHRQYAGSVSFNQKHPIRYYVRRGTEVYEQLRQRNKREENLNLNRIYSRAEIINNIENSLPPELIQMISYDEILGQVGESLY